MKHIIIVIAFAPYLVFAQLNNVQGVLSTSFNKANNLYDLGFYSEAITYFEEGLAEEKTHQKGMERLATCYMKVGNYWNAFSHYDVLFELTAVKDIEIIKNFAEVSLSTGNLEKASYWFTQASQIDSKNEVFKNRLKGVHNYSSFFKDSALVSFISIPLNTEDAEFALRPFNEGISIVSSKNNDLIIQKNYLRGIESFTNVYAANGAYQENDSSMRIIKFKNYLASNDGPISQSDRFVAISRNNGKSNKSINNTLGIFFYIYRNEEMLLDSEFPYNNKLYSNTHPWLNSIGDTLFYASNMKGNYGGFDIYYSVRSNYKWSIPINLGKEVNTAANELFPMIDNEYLYFTSDGHMGLGALDNFKVNLTDGNKEIINLGYPINSGFDDMAIYIKNDSGFVTSNRPGGKGLDDIYHFKITPAPVASVKIRVLDKLNELPIQDVTVSFKTYTDSLSLPTDKDGMISSMVTPNNFIFHIIKEDYEPASIPAIIHNGDNYEKTIYLEPILDLEVIAPDSIMFHLGKFELKKIAEQELLLIEETMKKYPHLRLMIAAHTDSRGSSEYNQKLSEKRAESTFDYLVKLGVDPIRITSVGYGESRLINGCKDGVKCSKEEHAANRRIEFFLSVEFVEEDLKEN